MLLHVGDVTNQLRALGNDDLAVLFYGLSGFEHHAIADFCRGRRAEPQRLDAGTAERLHEPKTGFRIEAERVAFHDAAVAAMGPSNGAIVAIDPRSGAILAMVSKPYFDPYTAYAQAAAMLKRPATQLKQSVAALGRSVGGPWRAEEKLAAVAGWLAWVDL